MSKNKVLDFEPPHKRSAIRWAHKEYLLMGAGPVNCTPRVLQALQMQVLNPIGKDMYKLIDEVKAMTQYLLQTKNKLTLVNQTSGNGGNEAIVTNLLDPGDKLVIAVGGVWGEKVLDMAKRYNIDALPLRKPPGEVFSLQELEAAVVSHKANLLFITHGESTGTTLQRAEGLGAMCHKYNCLLAVDAVVSIGVDPLFVDRWEIDAVNAGSQKAVGAPPGLSLLSFSPRAERRIKEKKTQPPYIYDMIRQGVYWGCFDDDHSRLYHYTFGSNLLSGLREALAEICEEGLEEMWERHKRTIEHFWEKLEENGFEIFVKKQENRFHGVTGVCVPEGVDEHELLAFMREKYSIEGTPGVGPTLKKAMRVGLLGNNSRIEVADYMIQALKDGVEHLRGKKIENGSCKLNRA